MVSRVFTEVASFFALIPKSFLDWFSFLDILARLHKARNIAAELLDTDVDLPRLCELRQLFSLSQVIDPMQSKRESIVVRIVGSA